MGATSLLVGIVFLCCGMAFFLSGMEAGVLALSRFRVRRQMRTGMRRARWLHEHLENPEDFLWTILVGNTLASFAVFVLVVAGLYELLRARLWLFALAFGVIIFLFYMLCDLLPKMLFRQFPNRLCLALAGPFRLVHVALAPLVSILTWFSDVLLRVTGRVRFQRHIFSSRRELRLAFQESAHHLTSEERFMVDRVLDLQDLTVRTIMVPLGRVIGVDAGTPVGEVLALCREHPVNRLPVWQGDGPARRIVGIANLSSFLYAEGIDLKQAVGRHAKTPLWFREDVLLEEALRRMQGTRQRMAVVVGFDRRELGVVSLHGILKSIFGEVTL